MLAESKAIYKIRQFQNPYLNPNPQNEALNTSIDRLPQFSSPADTQIKNYNELLDEFSLHQFVIRKGVTLVETEEFKSYKRIYAKDWPKIERLIA
jgi:hypothetical protein